MKFLTAQKWGEVGGGKYKYREALKNRAVAASQQIFQKNARKGCPGPAGEQVSSFALEGAVSSGVFVFGHQQVVNQLTINYFLNCPILQI